jgi:hypothetical protein
MVVQRNSGIKRGVIPDSGLAIQLFSDCFGRINGRTSPQEGIIQITSHPGTLAQARTFESPL